MSSPDSEKPGQKPHASVGQGWALSHFLHRNAKFNSLKESNQKHWGFPPHSLLDLLHLDGAQCSVPLYEVAVFPRGCDRR